MLCWYKLNYKYELHSSLQVIAFTCCVITTFLMVAATASSEWIKSEGWREGLFEQCVRAGAPMPMPFGGLPIPGCRRAHDAGMIANAALAKSCVVTPRPRCLCYGRRGAFTQPTFYGLTFLTIPVHECRRRDECD